MLGALMERKAQRGTNRACSGMIATVALPHTGQGLRRWAEHLDEDGKVKLMIIQRVRTSTLFAIYRAGTESVNQTPFRERKNV